MWAEGVTALFQSMGVSNEHTPDHSTNRYINEHTHTHKCTRTHTNTHTHTHTHTQDDNNVGAEGATALFQSMGVSNTVRHLYLQNNTKIFPAIVPYNPPPPPSDPTTDAAGGEEGGRGGGAGVGMGLVGWLVGGHVQTHTDTKTNANSGVATCSLETLDLSNCSFPFSFV